MKHREHIELSCLIPSDYTKHRVHSANIWPQPSHSPVQPIWWKEQVVLIFHAFSVFASLSPPPCLFLIPLEPISFSSMLVVVLLLGGSCLARQNAEHRFAALALLSTFSSRHLPRRCSHLASFSPPSPSMLPSSPPFAFSLSSPSPFLFPSLSPWLLIGCLSACGSCVLCVIEQRG